ncbi:hypothetical protein [Lewinella sp. 4G2]|uniref:hypothetical protein n=1 Tax=Lewinella sp. 4G2 TaxID=1803372 RepID=UPI0007B49B1A|nr:hypothetical protein [Lewinella sp. 4G2]OAV45197.1 hypothetical protein A3850_012145 [Lewinella sp. 4G2]
MRPHLTLLFLTFSLALTAQPDRNQKFAAAAMVGLNMSQIHGDRYFGYRKPGIRFGVETQVLFRPELFLTVGVGYSREGAQPNAEEIRIDGGNGTQLNLSMIQVPILLNYRIGNRKATGKRDNFALYRSPILQVGAKVTRLIKFSTANRGFFDQLRAAPPINEVGLEFRDIDVAIIAGATAPIGLRYAVFVQHALSVRGLYDPDALIPYEGTRLEVSQLRPYALSVGLKINVY